MKTIRMLSAVVFAAGLGSGIAQAQLQFVFVEKQIQYTQNSSAAPSVASGNPYVLNFAINGAGSSSLSSYTTVQITTTASGSSVSGPLNASTYSSSDDSWEMTALTYSTKGALDAAFANGLYAVKINSTTANVTLGAGSGPYTDNYPTAAPMVTGLSAGNFDGSGRLMINTSLTSYTFNLNGLAGYSSGGHVGIWLNGVQVGGNSVKAESIKFGSYNDAEVTSLTFNPSASTMVVGNAYTLEIEYNLAPNAATNLFGANELDLGLFTYRTQMTLIAVPEPSAYAAILGVGALAGVMMRRRRPTA
jgi:hypothetical protein